VFSDETTFHTNHADSGKGSCNACYPSKKEAAPPNFKVVLYPKKKMVEWKRSFYCKGVRFPDLDDNLGM
jgi:hypothetical protein